MISIQRKSLARSGTYSVVEVDRGRLEYIGRGKGWIRLSSGMKFKGGCIFSMFFCGTLYSYWTVYIDQREGERRLNFSLCGGICMVVVTPGR